MAFLVLASASCSNMTKEEGMTTLYEKIKGGGSGAGGGAALFENLTPNDIDTKMAGVVKNSTNLNSIKAGSVFIFEGTLGSKTYWGKVLVTKVESEKFHFQFVLYHPNKAVAAKDDDKDVKKGQTTELGKVVHYSHAAGIFITMVSDGTIKVMAEPSAGSISFATILLLN